MDEQQIEQLIAERGLTNAPCPLDEAYARLIPESIQEAHKIQRERIKDTGLRKGFFIVGNGCVYNVEEGESVLYFTNTALNPILKQENIADAVSQIRRNKYCIVKPEDFSLISKEAAKENGGAKRYVLSDLRLLPMHEDQPLLNNEYGSYKFYHPKYGELNNESQRSLAEQVHGQGEQFAEVLEAMINKVLLSFMTKEKIFILYPPFVKKIANDSPMAALGWLGDFGDPFFACIGRLDNVNDCVRGVLRP
ncbi:MAG: hypothetical protein MUP52_03400 [Candidatus Aminicenantes bacterium]|nr:hypothetical protein [Candidatus Aminicenantes bacterium]